MEIGHICRSCTRAWDNAIKFKKSIQENLAAKYRFKRGRNFTPQKCEMEGTKKSKTSSSRKMAFDDNDENMEVINNIETFRISIPNMSRKLIWAIYKIQLYFKI